MAAFFFGFNQSEFAKIEQITFYEPHLLFRHAAPLQVYREPATPFVADFVGRVNVVPVQVVPGGVQIGSAHFVCPHPAGTGGEARLYLRPEDILARPIAWW